MELFFTKRFKKDYKKLPQDIQRRTDKKLKFLLKDISHPSLRIKKVKKYKDVYELSVAMQYRCFLNFQGCICNLVRVGKHDEVLN